MPFFSKPDPPELLVDWSEEGMDRVTLWRLEQLLGMGFGEVAALRLAERRYVDLHAVGRLLARGCSRDLAVDILE